MSQSLVPGEGTGLSSFVSGIPDARIFKYTPEGKAAKKLLIIGSIPVTAIFLYFILPYLITILGGLITVFGLAIVATVLLVILVGMWYALRSPLLRELVSDKWRIMMHRMYYAMVETDPLGYLKAGIAWAQDGLKLMEGGIASFDAELKSHDQEIEEMDEEITESRRMASASKRMAGVPLADMVKAQAEQKLGRRTQLNAQLKKQREKMGRMLQKLLELRTALTLEIDDMQDQVNLGERQFKMAKSAERAAGAANSVMDQYGSRRQRHDMALKILKKQTNESLARVDMFMTTVQAVTDRRNFEQLLYQEEGAQLLEQYERSIDEMSRGTQQSGQQSDQVRQLLTEGSTEPIPAQFFADNTQRQTPVAVAADSKKNRYRDLLKKR